VAKLTRQQIEAAFPVGSAWEVEPGQVAIIKNITARDVMADIYYHPQKEGNYPEGAILYGKWWNHKQAAERLRKPVLALPAWVIRLQTPRQYNVDEPVTAGGAAPGAGPVLFQPRGPWADPEFAAPRGKPGPANEGVAATPDQVIRVPVMPRHPGGAVRVKEVPFWRAVRTNGGLIGWLLKGSPIDRKAGVYFLYDNESSKIYVGSSIGVSEQGNVRRTINRHFQKWQRLSEWYRKSRTLRKQEPPAPGGVVLPRTVVAVCVLLVPWDAIGPDEIKEWMRELNISLPGGALMHPARLVESWYLSAWSSELDLLNTIGLAVQVDRDDPDVPF